MKGGAGILHTRGIFTSCPKGESRIRFILYEQWALLLSEVLYCASEKPGRIFVLWDSHGYETETVKYVFIIRRHYTTLYANRWQKRMWAISCAILIVMPSPYFQLTQHYCDVDKD